MQEQETKFLAEVGAHRRVLVSFLHSIHLWPCTCEENEKKLKNRKEYDIGFLESYLLRLVVLRLKPLWDGRMKCPNPEAHKLGGGGR